MALNKPSTKYPGIIPKPILQTKKTGDRVIQLQKFLKWYGYSITVDGKFLSKTEKTLKRFQKKEGLKPDGIYGKLSYAKAIYYKKDKNSKKYPNKFPELAPLTARYAMECAYAYGTKKSVYKYEGGKPKIAYKKRLNEAYPKRSGWKYKKSRVGASCDVFAGVVLKKSGYKDAPHAMSKFVAWCRKNLKAVNSPKNGDILTRTNHIMVYLEVSGKKYVGNAHFQTLGGTYGIIEKPGKYTHIWRPSNTDACLRFGDKFTSVKYLKRFLNWYGDYNLEDDYIFDTLTENAVKDFQQKENLETTGIFDSKSLVKAKEVTRL